MTGPLPLETLLAAVAVVLFLLWRWEAGRGRRELRRRGRKGRRAERSAEKLLRQAGYRIEARQVSGQWVVLVDGAEVVTDLRVDLVVSRGRRQFVAEVKSGESGARPTHPGTRRQLLEYWLAFDCDGVLLVDMARGRVMEVEFPGL